MFCDAANGDFHLDVASCCAGAGEGGTDIGVLGVNCELTQVPTLSQWGMILLSLLLIAGSTLAMIKRYSFGYSYRRKLQ